MENKIYAGSGKKQKDWSRKISVCLSDLPKEHIFEYNGKEYIKLDIVDKKEADKYGKDVMVIIDTWKPENKKSDLNALDASSFQNNKEVPQDDLPF
jgi:hypothetical protein